MKQRMIIFGICTLVLTGCQSRISNKDVAFDSPARYSVSASRTTTVNMKGASVKEDSPQIMTEKMELVLAINSEKQTDGINAYQVTSESVDILRTDFLGVKRSCSPVKYLRGKPYKIKVSSDGQVLDTSSLEVLLRKASKSASEKTKKGYFRDHPDMLMDCHLVSTYLSTMLARGVSGTVSKGDTWNQMLTTPSPAAEFALPDRDISVKVQGVFKEDKIRKARLIELYTPTDGSKTVAPDIYLAGIKTKGLFAMFRNWKNQSLTGKGETVINLDTGLVESIEQGWQTKSSASFTMPIKGATSADITIDQAIEIKPVAKKTACGNCAKKGCNDCGGKNCKGCDKKS